MKLRLLTSSVVSALTLAGLTACSDSGTGTASTDSTVSGSISGFGSIILANGVAYNTDNVTTSTCEVDDDPVGTVCEDSLSVGMHISMELDSSGAAYAVYYDDDIEGPATNVTVDPADGTFSFSVFGVSVTTLNPGTQWHDFPTIPTEALDLEGVNVEVSGEWQGTVLVASYVEKQTDTSFEVEGTVGAVNNTDFELTLKSGTTLNVDASGANLIPQTGDYVEVEGNDYTEINGVTTLIATSIEDEDEDDFDHDGEVEITGTLLEDTTSSTGYSINSTDVDISNALNCSNLVGSVVEAEGYYVQTTGVLDVYECEYEDDELEMKCEVDTVIVPDATLPKVGTIACHFPPLLDTLTVEFRDSPELAEFSGDDSEDPFDLTDIRTGDCVEIEASRDTTTDELVLVAGLVELEDETTSGCDAYELKGPVDAIAADSITVLGVTFTVTAGVTDFQNGTPVVGDTVEIKDTNKDGTADSIEIDDSSSSDDSEDDDNS